jgi:hypothetical protein
MQANSGLVTRLVDRRAFLMTVAAAAAAQSLNARVPAALPSPDVECPVGFLDARSDSSPRIIPAGRIRRGYSFADRSVNLHFHGIRFPETAQPHALHRLMLDLEMQVPGVPAGNVPWHFWTFANDEVPNVSGEVVARIPLRADGSLRLTMTVEPTPDDRRQYTINLASGPSAPGPKLVPGTYLMAVPNDACTFPNAWRFVKRTEAPSNASSPIENPKPIGRMAAPFPYLTFTVGAL